MFDLIVWYKFFGNFYYLSQLRTQNGASKSNEVHFLSNPSRQQTHASFVKSIFVQTINKFSSVDIIYTFKGSSFFEDWPAAFIFDSYPNLYSFIFFCYSDYYYNTCNFLSILAFFDIQVCVCVSSMHDAYIPPW